MTMMAQKQTEWYTLLKCKFGFIEVPLISQPDHVAGQELGYSNRKMKRTISAFCSTQDIKKQQRNVCEQMPTRTKMRVSLSWT